MKERNVSEAVIENACLTLINSKGIFMVKLKDNTATQNGKHKKARPYELRGVADCALFHNGETIWVEFKKIGGVQSKYQKLFQKKLEDAGCKYLIWRSVKCAKDWIKSQRM